MSNSLPREIIKWLQGLGLSHSIKNYRRDFSNGFLVAEILSRYYPSDVQMHSFDTGMGPAAKKNNWGMLERIFTKHNISISRDVYQNVAVNNAKSVALLLSIIYWHIHNKSLGKSSSLPVSPVMGSMKHPDQVANAHSDKQTLISDAVMRNGDSEISLNDPKNDTLQSALSAPDGVIHSNAPKTVKLLGLDEVETETMPDEAISPAGTVKVSFIRTLCNILGINEPHISFHRNAFPSNIVRDMLVYKVEGSHGYDLDHLLSLLTEKTPELLPAVQLSPPMDFQLMFDTLLPCLINYGSQTQVFQVVISILVFMGDLCQKALQQGEAYKRLSYSREYNSVLQQIQLSTMDKIPYIAKLLHAYKGKSMADIDRLRILLDIKTCILKNKSGQPQRFQTKSTPFGSEFIFFLCALNSIDESRFHTVSHQFQIFHLSECLTIINSYKGMGSHNSPLLLSSLQVPDIASDISKNPGITILSTADLPALEVSAALHIVSSIVRAGVSLDNQILKDVIETSLKLFLKVAINPQCSHHLQKSYVNLVNALLEKLPIDGNRDAPETLLSKDLLGILSSILKWFSGDSLRVAVILTAPLLRKHQQITTSLVRAIGSLPDAMRKDLLKTGDKSTSTTMTWDLPFLLDVQRVPFTHTWWPFAIAMAVCKITEFSRSPIEGPYLQVLYAVVRTSGPLSRNVIEEGNTLMTETHSWNHLFLSISDHIIAGFAVAELMELSWSVFQGFIGICSTETVLKKFPSILSVLVYVHTIDRSKCRRKILSKLKKWAVRETVQTNEENQSQSPSNLELKQEHDKILLKKEAKRVLRIFLNEFPSLCGRNGIVHQPSEVPTS